MKTSKRKTPPISFIRKLCAHLGEQDLLESEERFIRYLQVVIKIFERIEQDKMREK